MSVQRFIVSGGSGAFLSDPATFSIASAPHGGWAEPQRSKAYSYGGYTYVGTVSGTTGDVEVFAVNEASRSVTSSLLHAALGGEGTADMHDNAAVIVRQSDHRLVMFYCRHADSTVRMRISTNSLDTDPTLSGGFASEVSLDAQLGATKYDYPVVLYLASTSTYYLFVRDIPSGGVNAFIRYSTSSDLETWASMTALWNVPGKTTYWQINGNDDDRIDIIVQNDNEDAVTNNNLYHFYLDASGGRHKSDGTTISATLPLTYTDVTQVTSETAGHHLYDLQYDIDGNPGSTFAVRVTSGGATYGARRARWTGSAWEVKAVVSSLSDWTQGICLDPDNFNHVLVSQVGLSTLSTMRDYRSLDGGTTWTPTTIATGGALWPATVRYGTYRLRYVWMGPGSYTTYTNWSAGITGYGQT